MIRPQGRTAGGRIMSMKNSNYTVGIRPAIFRLVAQCLNQLRHRLVVRMYLKHKAFFRCYLYRGADNSLARPGRKRANVSVRMAWNSFGVFPCKKKKSSWQLASRCCCNRVRPWHSSELVSFLIGVRTYQHPGIYFITITLIMSKSRNM